MIISELSNFFILDDVSINANPSEVYFLSHLFGNEMLSIPEDWPSRIYTSSFIYEILRSKIPKVSKKAFKIFKPNVPNKLKSKEKLITVTMFETGEITGNVMFLFDNGTATYLYTGIFTEIGGLYKNEEFMEHVRRGIDNVYINTTRCKGRSYIFVGDTVQNIKKISMSHPDSKIGLVIPTYGYELLLVHLAKEFPQSIYPTKYQRKFFTRLGLDDLLGNFSDSRIIIYKPGIKTELIESCECPSTSAYGINIEQWSPLPSPMDLRALLEIIKPKKIFPIKSVLLEDNLPLPSSFKWLINAVNDEEVEVSSNTDVSDSDVSSKESSFTQQSRSRKLGSEASTIVFKRPNTSTNEAKSLPLERRTRSPKRNVSQINQETTESQKKNSPPKGNLKSSTDLTSKRTRVIRQRTDIDFVDSEEDD